MSPQFLAYLAGVSLVFEEGWIALHQVVAARRGGGVRALVTRESIYATPAAARTVRAS